MLCPHCGQANAETALQCVSCNQALTSAAPAVVSPAGPAEGSAYSAIPMNPPRPEVRPPQNAGAYAGATYPGAEPVVGVSGLPYMSSPPQSGPQNAPPQPMYGAQLPGQPYGAGYGYAYAGAPGYGMAPPPAFCGVCGTPLYINYNRCARCQTPRGWVVNPNDPAAATFVPVGYVAPVMPLVFANEPENAVPKAGEAPPGWNWGAALQTTLWAASHRVWWVAGTSAAFSLFWMILGISLLTNTRALPEGESVVLTISTLGLLFWIAKSLYLGRQGNAMAWRSGRYANVEHLQQKQRVWAGWSIACFALSAILLGVVFIVAFRK